MKQIDANFLVYFTTKDKLPKNIKHDLTELFAKVLDAYLYNSEVEGNEVHLITCDDFDIFDAE